jgi:hypothetical protein
LGRENGAAGKPEMAANFPRINSVGEPPRAV